MLDAALGWDSRFECVLDGIHLSHGVGDLDQLRWAASPGDQHVHLSRSIAQYRHHVGNRHPPVDDGIRQLIENDEKVPSFRDGLCRAQPPGPGERSRALQILALPAESIAEPLELDSELIEGAVLTEACDSHLHELKEAHGLA